MPLTVVGSSSETQFEVGVQFQHRIYPAFDAA